MKVELNTLSSGFMDTDLINLNFSLVAQAFERTLFLDGTLPNSMTADLDFGGRQLLNPAPAVLDNQVPNFGQVKAEIISAGSGIVIQRQERVTATAAQTVVNLLTTSYTPGSGNLGVYVNGLRKIKGVDYTETNSTRITMIAPLSLNDKVDVFTNEYLGTVTPPTIVVPWSSLTSIPDFASRWPTYAEVTDKPATFTPSAHQHPGTDVTSFVSDDVRAVSVQATQPTAVRVGHVWLW